MKITLEIPDDLIERIKRFYWDDPDNPKNNITGAMVNMIERQITADESMTICKKLAATFGA